jgi:hypothetical protein
MPRIIEPPRDQLDKLRQPMEPGEKTVMEALDRSLDEDWEIYIQPHLNGLRPDFVLLHPKVGIIVIEVKNWNLDAMHYFVKTHRSGHQELYARDGNKEFAVENPFSKIQRYKKALYEVYCPRLRDKDGFADICPLVIFPSAERERLLKLQTPFIDSDSLNRRDDWFPVGGKDDLSGDGLRTRLPILSRRSHAMAPGLADDLRGWLVEPDFATTQRKPLLMDKKQRSLAEARTPSGYRRIKGPAGSGKSLVLAARAANLASEGKSVLIVTFNITLWHYLRDLVARGASKRGWMDNVTFTHFHDWCRGVCEEHYPGEYLQIMKPIRGIMNNQFLGDKDRRREVSNISGPILDEEVPRLAMRAAQSVTEKYDAVLVDEGQDFLPLWWNALRAVRKPEGEMVLVADATQDVYGRAGAWTDAAMTGAGFSGAWSQLKVGYRAPLDAMKFTSNFAKRFLPAASCDLPEEDQGSLELYESTVKWVQCDEHQAVKNCVDAVLAMHRETGKRGIGNSDIVFLCDSIDHGLAFTEELKTYDAFRLNVVHTYSQNRADETRRKMAFWMGDARMKATTFHSFKGWETRLLVVYIGNARGAETRAAIYAALTRLKRSEQGSHLTVVCSAPELAEFGAEYLTPERAV